MSEPKSETAEKVAKEPKEKASFLDKPITRRDLLKLTAVGGVSYVLKDFIESNQDTNEYAVPQRVKEAILLLKKLNLELPQDQLYGFTFPSTGEVAQKYEEALSRKVGDPPVSSLIIVQETEPKTLMRSIKLFVGLEGKHDDPASSKNQPHSFLYLPSYTQKDPVDMTASIIYHEGLHLFYQDLSSNGYQEKFDDEIMANIAEIQLRQLLRNRGFLKTESESDLERSYFQAVSENKRDIWEQALKKLYQLPQDCCVIPLTNK